ncbi:MAG: manganese efflux pump [Clostridia bacterium]|nr:manganese efflux pump [Clostridia bacterium]
MDWVQLILIAVSLSMDAFAVALCKGLCMKRINYRHAGIIALFFGGFQGLMPLIGWFLGKQFEQYITPIDHWIAFVLLGYIGGKMIWDALHEDNEGQACAIEEKLDVKEIFIMAVATSIDALAVGITFAFLQISIVPSVCAIGLITFGLSFAGVIVGNRFGNKFQSKAQLAGGTVLVLIGLKILLEHLGILVL